MEIIVGSTGFVGSNICQSKEFDGRYHSTDVHLAYGSCPDLLVYAGLRAEKYLANENPEKDLAAAYQAFDNIKLINPRRLVLISTIDVYPDPVDVDEDMHIDAAGCSAYGANRLRLEELVRQSGMEALIVRLPGLYGINLKKNFLYDLINLIPFMIKESKFRELCSCHPFIEECYQLQDNGFAKLVLCDAERKRDLRAFFEGNDFNALSFTDSRSVFQMYPLRMLWEHISVALSNGVRLLNIAVEPLSAAEIYEHIFSCQYVNELSSRPADYRMRTKHAELFGGRDGYIFDREFLLNDIAAFVRNEINKLNRGRI